VQRCICSWIGWTVWLFVGLGGGRAGLAVTFLARPHKSQLPQLSLARANHSSSVAIYTKLVSIAVLSGARVCLSPSPNQLQPT
jgi:hypothetical protein